MIGIKLVIKVINIVLIIIVKLIVGNFPRVHKMSSFNFQLIDFFSLQQK